MHKFIARSTVLSITTLAILLIEAAPRLLG